MNRIALLTLLAVGGLSISGCAVAPKPMETQLTSMETRLAFVGDLQASITTIAAYNDRLTASIDSANATLDARLAELKLTKLNLRIIPEELNADDDPVFRAGKPCTLDTECTETSCPLPSRFEFYLTQSSTVGGVTVAKTSLLGVDKYNDGPDRRSITFLPKQFPFADNPAVIVHVEVFDENGEFIAGKALAILVEG